MSSNPESALEQSIPKGIKYMETWAKRFRDIGHSEPRAKEELSECLADLYRAQTRSVVTLFCLRRSWPESEATENGNDQKVDHKNRRLLRQLTRGSKLDPVKVLEDMEARGEEELIEKIRAMMEDIHTNCTLIAEQMGVEFTAEKRSIN